MYFCGSIRGGRTDAELYQDIIEVMKKKGEVLTEHVGKVNLKEELTDNEIWKRDTGWLEISDLVIAECSQISLGVGYELAFAEAKRIPVHVFYNSERGSLSAMINGNPNMNVHSYKSTEELFSILNGVLSSTKM